MIHYLHLSRLFSLNRFAHQRVSGEFQDQIKVFETEQFVIVTSGVYSQQPCLLNGRGGGIDVGDTDEVHMKLTEPIPGNHVDNGKATRTTTDDGDIEIFHVFDLSQVAGFTARSVRNGYPSVFRKALFQ